MAKQERRGIIYSGRGCLAYLGPAPPLKPHMHPALGLYVGLDGPFRVGEGDPGGVPLLCVPPEKQVPAITPLGREMAFLFLSAEHPAFPDALARVENAGCSQPPDFFRELATALRDIRQQRTPGDEAVERITDILALRPTRNGSRRIDRALQWLRDHPATDVTLEQLADKACLSPRRFQTLFREETRMRFRRYRLWQRLQAAADHLGVHPTLTDLAVTAGFSDLAHLSRSFHSMFGISPLQGLRKAGPFSFRPIRSTRFDIGTDMNDAGEAQPRRPGDHHAPPAASAAWPVSGR